MVYKNNYVIISDISQNGGNACGIFDWITKLLIILSIILGVMCCLGSWGGLDETFLNPDTFLNGTFKKIKPKNWEWVQKLDPTKWR